MTDFFWGITELVVLFHNPAPLRCEEAVEAHLIPHTMTEEGQQETFPEEWVKSIISVAPILFRWLADEEGKCLH